MVQGHEGARIMYWHQLDGKNLDWTSSHRPAKRLCAFHAKWATFSAVNKGWINEGEVLIPEFAWGSLDFDKEWIFEKFFDGWGRQIETSMADSPLQPKSFMETFGLMVSILFHCCFFFLHFYHFSALKYLFFIMTGSVFLGDCDSRK